MRVNANLDAVKSSERYPKLSAAAKLRTSACAAVCLCVLHGEIQAQGDTWIGPWDWACQIEVGPPSVGSEISHAALIPHGAYRGMVLMWRAPRNVPPVPPQTETWIFNPAIPATLLKVDQDLESDIFCSSMSWDRNGQLVVAGGAPGGTSAPTDAYRFFPSLLRYPAKYVFPIAPCNGAGVGGVPWKDAGDMSIGRYYPTLITLFKGDILGTPPIAGASSFVLGGLADLPPNPAVVYGNDYWQMLESTSVTWSRTLHSPNQAFTDPFVGGATEQYDLKSVAGLPLPNPYVENYPRTVQLTTLGQGADLFTKSIFVANDIWPDNGPSYTAPGDAWVIRPRYSASPANWELWSAHNATVLGPNPSIDRLYGSAVLLHTTQSTLASNGRNRVLVFGGQQIELDGPRINSTVQEFRPGVHPANPGISNGGKWILKNSGLSYPRVRLNAIVLPTGEVLIVGGMKACPPCDPGQLMPEHRPELYTPGDAGLDTGASSTVLASSNPAAPGFQPYARGYHQVAMLLPDGRVFNAGGAPFETESGPDAWDCTGSSCSPTVPAYKNGMYTGEIYSPPYMGLTPKPWISLAPTTVQFGSGTFQVNVDVATGQPIDRFVLLRPAAVTHHFDNDQRYIELPFSSQSILEDIETFNVAQPAEDLGPPGYYMLFAVRNLGSQQRVPSEAWWLKIE